MSNELTKELFKKSIIEKLGLTVKFALPPFGDGLPADDSFANTALDKLEDHLKILEKYYPHSSLNEIEAKFDIKREPRRLLLHGKWIDKKHNYEYEDDFIAICETDKVDNYPKFSFERFKWCGDMKKPNEIQAGARAERSV